MKGPGVEIDDELARSILKLAKLKLRGDEFGEYRRRLQEILEYVGMLDELDLKSVVPTACAADSSTILRDDDGTESSGRDRILSNAPSRAGAFFKVPRIIDQGGCP